MSKKPLLAAAPRLATHGFILAVALLGTALVPLGLRLPAADGDVIQASAGAPRSARQADLRVGTPSTAAQAGQLPALRVYQVQPGDALTSIARQAGINLDTLLQVNGLNASQPPVPGDVMIIPPIDGTMIDVPPGETLRDLTNAYRADITTIRAVNGLAEGSPLPRQVFIPAADTQALAPRQVTPGPAERLHHLARFIWPAQGTITTYFWQYHPGLDIANAVGTPEVAADAGQVVFAGWGSYGIYVEIDHGNGFHTIYGHMSAVLVRTGEVVTPGQEIGLMGSTGRSTGPHLHFEIRYQGVPQNPLDFLS
ncbi:MAG TPA: M23 family metallopeptidase [Candidatus Dormibacteraeota bacterium]